MSLAAWQARAIERSAALGIHQNKLLESAELVLSVMGHEWLDAQALVTTKSQVTFSDVHILYRHLTSTSDDAIVTVCELAQYLREFMSDPAINDILKDLRSDKYESTLLELALATRWQAAGAKVTLQPKVPSGFADFDAVIHSQRVVIEASTFPSDDFSDLTFKVAQIVEQTVKSTVGGRFPVAVKVRLTEYIDGDFNGKLRRSLRELLQSLSQAIGQGLLKPMVYNFDFGSIEAEPLTNQTERITDSRGTPSPLQQSEWSLAGSVGLRRREPGSFNYTAANNPVEKEFLRSFVKLPDIDDEPNVKILKKLAKESRQLRGSLEPRIVILDVSALGKKGLSMNDASLQSDVTHAMRNSPRLAGLWLYSRIFPASKRHLFMGRYFPNPACEYKLPEAFTAQISKQERDWDFVNSRPLLT